VNQCYLSCECLCIWLLAVKDQGNNLYFLHSFTFHTLYSVLCTFLTLYNVQSTITSYFCTLSLLMKIYRRQEEGDQGATLYLFNLHSSYYLVTRPYLSIFLHNKVTLTHNNLCQPLQGLATLVAYSLGVRETKMIVC
jgi:hypothetical protein